MDFYFLNFTDFFWRCVTSGNDAISISLDFVGSQIFTFCRDFLLNKKLNVEVGLLLAGVFFGNR